MELDFTGNKSIHTLNKLNDFLQLLLKESNCTHIGWDVGGMHGSNNALCFLKPEPAYGWVESTLSIPKQKSSELLAERIVQVILEHKSETILLAIDAPLCFPKAFIKQLTQLEEIESIPYETQISNPLAYRHCEFYLQRITGKRPLSPSFDQLTSLVLLVLRVFQLLKDRSELNLFRIPYDGNSIKQGINAFECYPALLKPLKKPLKSGHKKKASFDAFVTESGLQLSSSHKMDAQYCALFAVYEHLIHSEPFSVHHNYNGNLQEEGWIYGPY